MCTPTVEVMVPISPISRAWISAIMRPFLVALVVMMGVASLFLTTQVVYVPFLPSPAGIVSIWCAVPGNTCHVGSRGVFAGGGC